MRILHVNKFLYRRGGAEAYMEDVAALQSAAGNEIAFFAMDHPENRESAFSAHFPSYVEFEPMPATLGGKAKAVGRVLHSSSARRGMAAVVEVYRPDVAHLHNVYHHLSPSILSPLAGLRVPVVMTLHDYKLACPTYRFLDHGEVCEACLGGKFHHAALRRCKDGSLGASVVSAAELYLHTRTGAYGHVDRFVCPSRFLAGKMTAAGVYPDRMRQLDHFVDTAATRCKEVVGGGVVFAGRLSHEKGADVLLEAAVRLPSDVMVHIAGEGPERPALEATVRRLDLAGVRFHGRLPQDRVRELIRSCAVVVVPSRWYENQPLVVLEAFAAGVPVVASDLGGLPELVEQGVDGQLVPPGDPAALADALCGLLAHPDKALAMGRAARAKAERRFAPERHLSALQDIYSEAGEHARARP